MQVWCDSSFCAKCKSHLTGHETNDMALHELLRIDSWQLERPNVHGTPGVVVKGNKVGYEGELALANSFTMWEEGGASPAEKFDLYFNVGIPRTPFADVDCVVLNGNDVLLLDAKMYKGGNVIYRVAGNQFHVLDSRGTTSVRQYTMTRNMANAEKRWQGMLPGANVKSMVVMLPTINGQGRVSSEVKWLGGVEVIETGALLEMLIETESKPPPELTKSFFQRSQDARL